MLRGLKQALCAPGPRDHTETETELCLSISCGGTSRQWSAAGTGALGVGMASVLLEEVAINPTIELPELTQDWEIDSWRAQTKPCVHQDRGEGSSDPPKRLTQTCPGESMSLRWRRGSAVVGGACCRVRGTECSSSCKGPFEGGHHYLHYI